VSASIGIWSFWAFLGMMMQAPIMIVQRQTDKVDHFQFLSFFTWVLDFERFTNWKCHVLGLFLRDWTTGLRFYLLLPLYHQNI